MGVSFVAYTPVCSYVVVVVVFPGCVDGLDFLLFMSLSVFLWFVYLVAFFGFGGRSVVR